MSIELPALPYEKNALEPIISAETLDFHHGKHHNAYVVNLNNLIKDTDLASKSLEEIIAISAGDASKAGMFNNAAQVWNHTFYWNCMKPNGGGKPTGAIAAKIDADLGGYDKFVELFKTAATTQFGSGWAWLVLNKDGKLEVTKTPNADLPLAHGQKALLTIDVWEHAYYIDFRNRRPDYISTFLEKLVNWDFVNQNLA
ncbi:MAG: superoxide dismutase [Moraxellaceae bacterium]|jgi:Fe-Mn family superoxide dismutase|nr:superoxide dismutase [Moraxellaceae bacterium]MBP7229994.1 superoxide dismutase [Moraxellaceae bacterium]MBP8853213.1 superoxide dismutase [Moraxellaceae bacterium]MBP9046395.1 superoxide dismutase [Moraxellaceae bacterium]MBP9731166.1 superoxide dismutase [Moraxellaceae bacterium]